MDHDDLIITTARGDGTNWGLAALLIGCTLILMGPLLLLVNIQLALYGPVMLHMGRTRIDLAVIGMYVAIAVGTVVTISSVVFGIVGIVQARAEGRSVALGVAGLMASLFGAVVMCIAAVDLIMVMDMFKHAQVEVILQ